MGKHLKVACPHCDSVLIIDRVSGKVVEVRKPLVAHSSGDRLQDSFQKMESDKREGVEAFDKMKENQAKRKKLAEDLFNASLDDARSDASEKPHSIFDSD